jgi:hypothetical protein
MHCQHDNGFWLVLLLVNFCSFLPHRLQEKHPVSSCCLFFLLKSTLLLASAAIPCGIKLLMDNDDYIMASTLMGGAFMLVQNPYNYQHSICRNGTVTIWSS